MREMRIVQLSYPRKPVDNSRTTQQIQGAQFLDNIQLSLFSTKVILHSRHLPASCPRPYPFANPLTFNGIAQFSTSNSDAC